MSLTLALDTATDVASVAVAEDGRLLAELSLPGRRHATSLLPGISGVLQTVGAGLPEVGRILCADGPGSFTGIRIALATAQGMVRANEAVTVGTLPSLLATAWGARSLTDGPVAAVYDALRGDVFGAVYRITAEGVEALLHPTVLPLRELATRAGARPSVVVGDLVVLDRPTVLEWTGRAPVAASPRAAALIALDGVPGGVRDVPDLVAFEPDYGRPAEAQVRWERAHGRALPDPGGEYR